VQQFSKLFLRTQEQLQQQQTALAQLQQATTGKQKAWILAEVNYLAQSADYHLRFAHDVPTAIILLQTANQRLAELDNTNIVDLRQLFSKAIVELQATPRVDAAGILSQLNALQEKTDQLPLAPVVLPAEKNTQPLLNPPEANTWQRALALSWQTLQKLIVVRRVDQAVKPLLSVEQQGYLQQNLRLLLQRAEFALLRNQATAYQSSLQQAQALIQHYFALDAALTKAVSQNLSELQRVNVAPVMPDISALVTAVQKISANATDRSEDEGEGAQ
jgi:uroporphyrin-3 C-methyltransferase